MRQGTPRIAALGRSLAVLEAVLRSKGAQSIRAIAADLGLPRATAHRQVVSLVGERYLTRLSGGWYGAGPRLLALAQLIDANEPLVAAAKPILHRLSGKLKCVVQLGTLDNEMVTYRYKTGPGADAFFTRVGLQLEAYCTGIGKVLLAHLPDAERSAYLATGPFPALTHKTITDQEHLRSQLGQVRERGWAHDDEEIAEGLVCFAVPVRTRGGSIPGAISASITSQYASDSMQERLLDGLRGAAQEIAAAYEEEEF